MVGVAPAVHCTSLDYAVIAVYFFGVLLFGLHFSRYARTTRDFFFGGQRFSAWVLAASMLASVVGSYSFVKYTDVGFRYGLSSSMTYLNDWFYVPLLMFVWIPVIYFARVRSVPEYFERRFDTRARLMCAVLLAAYMLGYVGYTIFTMGKVANTLLGVDLFAACAVITFITAIYITVGGQTAIIFTDLAQAVLLIGAGMTLVVLGVLFLGNGDGFFAGLHNFWAVLPIEARVPFAGFNAPADFNFVGVFWQDMANSCVFFFINQGLIMRYLAAKSMQEARKTLLINSCCLLPFAVIIVGGPGWVGNAIARVAPEALDPDTPGADAFVVIAHLLCKPGVFGLMVAALIAALMSTVDTMINALAAIAVVDIYQPYLARGRDDRHYLKVARIVSIGASVAGLLLVEAFARFESIYEAHAAFTAAVTPPLAVAVIMGILWKRYTPAAAFWTMLIGAGMAVVSFIWPEVVKPFMDLHGMVTGGAGFKPSYMRALFLLIVSGAGGVVVTVLTRPKPEEEIVGLWIGSIEAGRWAFKGGRPNDRPSNNVLTELRIVDAEPPRGSVGPPSQPIDHGWESGPADHPVVSVSRAEMDRLGADPGDLLYIADARRILGGLRSLHATAGAAHDGPAGLCLTRGAVESGSLRLDRRVRVERII